jgi:predicted enzyme related to lactoylglutathione lyase
MAAKLIACNVPTSNSPASQAFYKALLGQDFARSYSERVNSHHVPLSNDGLWLWITDRQAADERITCVFAVDNLDHAMASLRNNGGFVFFGPIDTPISPKLMQTYAGTRGGIPPAHVTPTMGRYALVRDPDGNVIGLMQLEPHAESFFKAGAFAEPLSPQVHAAHQRTMQAGKVLEGEAASW